MHRPAAGAAPAFTPYSPAGAVAAGAAAGAAPHERKRRVWPFVVGGGALVVLAGLASCTALVLSPGEDGTADRLAGAASAAPDAGSAPAEEAPAESSYPTFAAQTFTGTGDFVQAVDLQETAIVTFECATCTGNTVLKTNGRDSLLVNTIGPHRGQYVVNTTDGGIITQMTVNADAAWTITVADLTTVPIVAGPASGSGDSVIVMSGDFSVAALTNDGDSNFVVQEYGTSSFSPLIANEIGAYSGTVEMEGPAVVQVTSNGAWSITPQ
ncbi:hypothetical protein [Clavibacter lycopersici]|uniref:hypothetical protein n=1 Tax=Clavibacter lycopersici TaxID=2301718 RepID=UPI0011C22368|nr:hypothetical protein [Clavibacter lycopersici]